MIKIGQRYRGNSMEFILAQVASFKVCLIDLQTGNRWMDPVTVIDTGNISDHEWLRIIGTLCLEDLEEMQS